MTKKQKRIAELIKAAPHMTADDVAKTLRVKRAAVYWVGRSFGIRCKPARRFVSDRDRRRITAMSEAKMPSAEIADRLGFSACTIRRVRRKLGIQYREVPSNSLSRSQRIALIRRHLYDGQSLREIAKSAGVSRSTIAGMVYRARKQNWDLSEGVEKEAERV